MIAKARECWQAVIDHPILQLELRRTRRKRWWPGRRFFLFYPVLLGGAVGCGVIVTLSTLLERLSLPISGFSTQLAALVTGLSTVCLVGTISSLLTFALSWIAPALTAATIAHERELGTLDLLRATLLTERSIVWGKLGGCLVRLWPGILTLALLMPFQLVIVMGGGLLGSPITLTMVMGSVSSPEGLLAWWLLTGLVALLKPWCDLALYATVGLFVSTLARSSGMAVAVSYGAIIAMRVALCLGTTLVNAALMVIPGVTLGASGTAMSEIVMAGMWVIPALTSLAVVLVELVVAALLVWGAIGRLKRM
jgi:ABC-type transport system involved in multi-copper enzyme maturation permease subunit